MAHIFHEYKKNSTEHFIKQDFNIFVFTSLFLSKNLFTKKGLSFLTKQRILVPAEKWKTLESILLLRKDMSTISYRKD